MYAQTFTFIWDALRSGLGICSCQRRMYYADFDFRLFQHPMHRFGSAGAWSLFVSWIIDIHSRVLDNSLLRLPIL